jgi:hypothetical protein
MARRRAVKRAKSSRRDMSRANKQAALKSLSSSMLDQDEEAALAAVLKNLRILGRTLPVPETYERARLAAVEVMLKRDDRWAPSWLRFYSSLLELAREACAFTRRLSHRERNALHFFELIISGNFRDWPVH